MSKATPMLLSIVLGALLVGSAYATDKGEVDAADLKASPVKKVSPMEKAEARAARKTEGAAAAKSEKPSTVTEGESGAKRPAVAKLSAEEKAAARAKRKAAAAEAVKKGQTVEGEVGTAK